MWLKSEVTGKTYNKSGVLLDDSGNAINKYKLLLPLLKGKRL